eukprot:2793617-Prymnesium_polylepis.1
MAAVASTRRSWNEFARGTASTWFPGPDAPPPPPSSRRTSGGGDAPTSPPTRRPSGPNLGVEAVATRGA